MIKRIVFVIAGTVLVALGVVGFYGVIGLSDEYFSQPVFLFGQSLLPLALIILGVYFLAQFYKKSDNKG